MESVWSQYGVSMESVWSQYVKDKEISVVFDRLCTAKKVRYLFPVFKFMGGWM